MMSATISSTLEPILVSTIYSKNNREGKRVDLFLEFNKYFLTLCAVIFSSRASAIANSDIVLFVITSYAIGLNLLKNNSGTYIISVFKIILFFSIVTLIYLVKNGSIDVYTWLGFLIKILLSFSSVYFCRGQFEGIFIKTVYWLSLVSLPLYLIQLINFDVLFGINDLFGIPSTRGQEANSNSLIFNMHSIHRVRNSGFMWEPGAYAAVVIFALLLSFKIRNKMDNHKIIFMICLVTTFSTTGYISMFIIFSYFFYKKLKGFALLLIIPISIVLLNINFITKKITDQFNDIEDELLMTQFSGEYSIHLNRFASFYADYNTFLENPLLGLGMDIYSTGKSEFYKEYDENVVRTSGLMLSLVKIGLFGMMIYLIILYRRIKARYIDKRFAILFCVVSLIILFSNPLEFSTIMLTFLFL